MLTIHEPKSEEVFPARITPVVIRIEFPRPPHRRICNSHRFGEIPKEPACLAEILTALRKPTQAACQFRTSRTKANCTCSGFEPTEEPTAAACWNWLAAARCLRLRWENLPNDGHVIRGARSLSILDAAATKLCCDCLLAHVSISRSKIQNALGESADNWKSSSRRSKHAS